MWKNFLCLAQIVTEMTVISKYTQKLLSVAPIIFRIAIFVTVTQTKCSLPFIAIPELLPELESSIIAAQVTLATKVQEHPCIFNLLVSMAFHGLGAIMLHASKELKHGFS